MTRALLVLTLVAAASTAHAADRWGVSIWGLSYHVDRRVDYNEDNWGLGVRYYFKPDRLFLEGDALRNSNRGLVLPVSLGAEFGIAPLPAGCRLSGVVALTAAYYQYPDRNTTDFKIGPVPGVAIGCGRVKANVMAVLRKSSEPLAALTASLTIMF
ncbi:MAG: hypothetical protein JWL71_1755 [Acidobacteria bacterium]|nr:hypothetical protein [Acidobacteriota bacterium]